MKRLDRAKILDLSSNCGYNEQDTKDLRGRAGVIRNIYVDKGEGWFSCSMLLDGKEVNNVLSDVKLEKIDD